MKISNPMRLGYNRPGDTSNYWNTLVAYGDIIRKYCSCDSIIESDWHIEANNSDSWVKFSFNGGATYPLKFKFKNRLIFKFEMDVINGCPKAGEEYVYDFSDYTIDQFNSFVNGKVSLFANTETIDANNTSSRYITNLPFFRYMFDSTSSEKPQLLRVIFTSNAPEDTVSVSLVIEVDYIDGMAFAIGTPIYSSPASLAPIAYTEEGEWVAKLDNESSEVTLVNTLDNINSLRISGKSADEFCSGNVVLKFKCVQSSGGTVEFESNISVDNNCKVTNQTITPPEHLNGTLTITRLHDDSNDTLKDSNGNVISFYITNVVLERI